jgi:hypothetical protein
MTLALIVTTSLAAAAPEVRVDDDGFVRATVVLDASPSEVRALLADGAAMAETSPEVLDARATTAGTCERLDLDVRGLFTPFSVTTLRCPTADGWTERLLDARVFTAWDARWTLAPLADGRTRVDAAIRTEVALPVPASLVQARTAASLRRSLDRLVARLADRAVPVAAAR